MAKDHKKWSTYWTKMYSMQPNYFKSEGESMTKYRITDVSKSDAYYSQKDKVIGLIIDSEKAEIKKWPRSEWYDVFYPNYKDAPFVNDRPVWSFYEVKLEEIIPSYKVLQVGKESAWTNEDLKGKTIKVLPANKSMTRHKGFGWYEAEFKFDEGTNYCISIKLKKVE